MSNLLKFVGKPILLPAIPHFVAREKLVENRNGELPISYVGSSLKTNFLDLVEENITPMTVRQRKLLKSSVDRQILAALGDKDMANITRAPVALSHAFEFLKTADRGVWYIFYIKDVNGIVWAVGARWRSGDGGWRVEADSVEGPSGWDAGVRLLSR